MCFATKKRRFDYEKALIFFTLALFITLVEFLFVYSYEISTGSARLLNLANLSCGEVGGHWSAEKQECEYTSLAWCGAHHGIFEECKSDCFIEKNKDCILDCVPTCKLNVSENIFGITPDYSTYSVDGTLIKLSGNYYNLLNDSEVISTRIWGIRAGGDLNNDGFDDSAMILLHSSGDRNFYYLVSSLFEKDVNKYLGTNAILLGENVMVEDIGINQGEIIVRYFDHAKGEEKKLQPKHLKILKAKILEENNLVKESLALEHKDKIRVSSVDFGSEIKSPLVLAGEARGTWFFEGSAPIVLTDWDGLIIAEGYIQTESDWMTEDFVPFHGELEFDEPSFNNSGALILQKDNPSGLSENDDAFEIQVYFD